MTQIQTHEKKVRCIETGRGRKGSMFVCYTPQGDIAFRALKQAPHLWSIEVEYPTTLKNTLSTHLRAPNQKELRRYIEEWVEYTLFHQ